MPSCCVSCRECGHVAYCLDDRPDMYPCAHGEPLCGDCLESCEECLPLILAALVGEVSC